MEIKTYLCNVDKKEIKNPEDMLGIMVGGVWLHLCPTHAEEFRKKYLN